MSQRPFFLRVTYMKRLEDDVQFSSSRLTRLEHLGANKFHDSRLKQLCSMESSKKVVA
jgi:hypothetical protein